MLTACRSLRAVARLTRLARLPPQAFAHSRRNGSSLYLGQLSPSVYTCQHPGPTSRWYTASHAARTPIGPDGSPDPGAATARHGPDAAALLHDHVDVGLHYLGDFADLPRPKRRVSPEKQS